MDTLDLILWSQKRQRQAAAKGKGGSSWSSYWSTLISATVEDAAPTHVVLTFPSEGTSVATDITCTVNAVARVVSSASWTGGAWTVVLASDVVNGDVVVITFIPSGGTTAVTNNVAIWYDALSVTTCVAAYKAIGAADAAASYVNLKNPGTYDLTPTATPPDWSAVNGWKFGVGKYFDSGLTLSHHDYTVIFAVNNPLNEYQGFCGCLNNSYPANQFYVSFLKIGATNEKDLALLCGTTTGDRGVKMDDFTPYANTDVVIGANINNIYVDGEIETTEANHGNSAPDDETFFIGAVHWSGHTPPYYMANLGYMYSFAIYDALLTSAQIKEISRRMSFL